jgi:hypothetical protein
VSRFRARALRTVICAGLCAAFLTSVSPARASTTPAFGAFIDPFPGYEGQSKCDPSPKPGVLAFQSIVLAREPGTSAGSISRDCSIGGQSEHKEGRAWDWGARADVPSERAAAKRTIDWLKAPDKFGNDAAMARRFGVMYLIFDRRIWFPGTGWRTYCVQKQNGCVSPGTTSDVRDPHTSHVHISFTWAGALKQTSYWHPEDSMASALASSPQGGYWVAGHTGAVIASDAGYYGSPESVLDKPVAAIASTPSGGGYWMSTTRGHVLAFGDARSRGQVNDSKVRIVDMAATPSGRGYWLVSSGGRVMPFGDAERYGASRTGDSGAGVIAILPTATGLGYTLVSADGRMTAFGDAVVSEAPAAPTNGSFVAATSSVLGGAWLITGDGKVVSAGGAPSLPDLSRKSPSFPVIDIAASASGNGYQLLLADGTVKAFGDARRSSTRRVTIDAPTSRPPRLLPETR